MKQPRISILSEARAGIILAGGTYHQGCEALNNPRSALWDTIGAWVRAKSTDQWDVDDCKALRLEIFRLVKGWARANEQDDDRDSAAWDKAEAEAVPPHPDSPNWPG